MALRRLVMPERTGDSADRKTRPNRVLFARGVPTQQYWEGERGYECSRRQTRRGVAAPGEECGEWECGTGILQAVAGGTLGREFEEGASHRIYGTGECRGEDGEHMPETTKRVAAR